MKKQIISMVFILLCMGLSGCVKNIPIATDTFPTELGTLEINVDYIFAYQMDVRLYQEKDRVEMIDASDRNHILIHIMENNTGSQQLDYKTLITPDWIYSTQDMSKIENTVDLTEDEGFEYIILQYTELIDFSWFASDALILLAQSLQEPQLTRVQQKYVLKGDKAKTGMMPIGEKDTVELVYNNNRLQELHFRRVFDVASTKQQSNYIYGTHYHLTDEFELEFVDLSQFP